MRSTVKSDEDSPAARILQIYTWPSLRRMLSGRPALQEPSLKPWGCTICGYLRHTNWVFTRSNVKPSDRRRCRRSDGFPLMGRGGWEENGFRRSSTYWHRRRTARCRPPPCHCALPTDRWCRPAARRCGRNACTAPHGSPRVLPSSPEEASSSATTLEGQTRKGGQREGTRAEAVFFF